MARPSWPWTLVTLAAGESYRFILSKGGDTELDATVAVPDDLDSNLHEVFDRAHFPTMPLEIATAKDDVTPLPLYEGKLQPIKSDVMNGVLLTDRDDLYGDLAETRFYGGMLLAPGKRLAGAA